MGMPASVGMQRDLLGISVLTAFGGVPLTLIMIFLEHTRVVSGGGHRGFGSARLPVDRGMPLGDGVKDDLSRERRHLSKLRVTNHFSLNPLPLRLQVVSYLLQVSDQPIDF